MGSEKSKNSKFLQNIHRKFAHNSKLNRNFVNENRQNLELLVNTGDINEAQNRLTEALENHPEDASLHYLQGRLYARQQQWGPAQSAFLKAEMLDPNGPASEAREMLGGIYDFFCKDIYNP